MELFIQKKKTFNFADFNNIQLDFLNANSTSTGNVNTIFSLYFTCTEYNKKYIRKYMKLSEVFSLIEELFKYLKLYFKLFLIVLVKKFLLKELIMISF